VGASPCPVSTVWSTPMKTISFPWKSHDPYTFSAFPVRRGHFFLHYNPSSSLSVLPWHSGNASDYSASCSLSLKTRLWSWQTVICYVCCVLQILRRESHEATDAVVRGPLPGGSTAAGTTSWTREQVPCPQATPGAVDHLRRSSENTLFPRVHAPHPASLVPRRSLPEPSVKVSPGESQRTYSDSGSVPRLSWDEVDSLEEHRSMLMWALVRCGYPKWARTRNVTSTSQSA